MPCQSEMSFMLRFLPPMFPLPPASTNLFEWKIHHAPEFDYTMWEDRSGSGGGFNKITAQAPVGLVLVYIDSDDIDADLKKIQQLGGSVVAPKTEIPGTGWFGIFKDPTGNTLALYTSMNPQFNQ